MTFFQRVGVVDQYALNFSGLSHDLVQARRAGDTSSVAQASLELTKASLEGTGYVTMAAQKTSSFFPISACWTSFAQSRIGVQTLGVLGCVPSLLALGIELNAIARQEETLSAVLDAPSTFSSETRSTLKETFNKLQALNPNRLFQSLPDFLKEEIPAGEMSRYLEQQVQKIEQGKGAEALQWVQEVRRGALRKQVVHCLGIAASFLGIAASLALIIGCPPLGIAFFTTFTVLMTVVIYGLKKGWVEHRGEGFNWRFFLPRSFQHKPPAPLPNAQ